MILTSEERKSRLWKKVCDYVAETTEENRRRNDAHLSELETTKLRARNEALTWMLDHFLPEIDDIEGVEPDFRFDGIGDQEEN